LSHRALLVALVSALSAPGLLACTYDGEDLLPPPAATFTVVSSVPAPATVGVPRSLPIDVVFNATPDAASVSDLVFRVFSGLIEGTGTVKVDLLARRLRLTPFDPLRPGLRHQVYLASGVRGLSGARLAHTLVFDFTTGEELGTPPAPPAPSTVSSLQPLWDARCASCHGGAAPRAGLDLSSPTTALRDLSSAAVSADLLRVKAGDHARSALMLKLLGEGALGLRMPPDAPLAADQLQQIADWIDAGAR